MAFSVSRSDFVTVASMASCRRNLGFAPLEGRIGRNRGRWQAMRDQIARLFQADGPFVTAYLDARSDTEQAQQKLVQHWKSVRSELEQEGATDDDLAAVDGAIERHTHIGGDTF